MRRNQRDSRPGFSRPVPRVGQPGSGVTPAKNPCGWHGEDQDTKRRDRRSEDCVLELSRSHPAGVILVNAKEGAQRRVAVPQPQRQMQESRRDAGATSAQPRVWLCHDNCADTWYGMRATLRITRCAKMT